MMNAAMNQGWFRNDGGIDDGAVVFRMNFVVQWTQLKGVWNLEDEFDRLDVVNRDVVSLRVARDALA